MTTDEAINVINTWYEPMCNTLKGSLTHEFLDAVDALKAKEIKYRWHDLRIDPTDLPEEDKRILFYTIGYGRVSEERIYTGCLFHDAFFNDDHEGYVTFNRYPIEDVIAWREIEPFEVEDGTREE